MELISEMIKIKKNDNDFTAIEKNGNEKTFYFACFFRSLD